MNRFLYLSGILIIYAFTAVIPINAQSSSAATMQTQQTQQVTQQQTPPPISRPLVLNIESRILGARKTVIWSENNSRVTIPGSPTGVQLVGANIIVSAQFTPFISSEGNVLVAQGQIWIAENDIVTYYTSIQTIPMEFGEKIYFFPLGSSENLNPSIEIIITVTPYP